MVADLLKSWRHLFAAVLALSTEGGPVDQRLRNAYTGNLQRISPTQDLPTHLRPDFEKLMDELAALFDGERKNELGRASMLAKKVVALYDRVTRELQ